MNQTGVNWKIPGIELSETKRFSIKTNKLKVDHRFIEIYPIELLFSITKLVLLIALIKYLL